MKEWELIFRKELQDLDSMPDLAGTEGVSTGLNSEGLDQGIQNTKLNKGE